MFTFGKQGENSMQEEQIYLWQNGEKRYKTFNRHLREIFGEKVFKVSLDAGFTCPNRDGTLGYGGCIYCSLSIATRPDCLPEEVLDYLEELNQRTYLWVELGLQSIHDQTMEWVGRGHTYEDFLKGLEKLRSRGIRVCAHIILGLPGETISGMMATARAIADLPIQGVKIHLLHVLKGTPLAKIYEREPFPMLSQEEYVSLVADIIEILPPEMIIHRLTGDAPRKDLIAPLWSLKKWEILNAFDKELEQRKTWQGKKHFSD